MRLMMCDFFDVLTPEILILLCFFHPSLLLRGNSYVVIVSRLQGVKDGLRLKASISLDRYANSTNEEMDLR